MRHEIIAEFSFFFIYTLLQIKLREVRPVLYDIFNTIIWFFLGENYAVSFMP
jgi:hypothetical protein